MDSTAISLCMDNNLPILVLDMEQPRSLVQGVMGEELGTIIKE
jgi:uridylate kinase